MTHPATDETPAAPAAQRTFEVEAVITVTVDDNPDLDAAYDARAQVDELLQRAWETDNGRHFVKKWHFELLDEGLVTEIDKDGNPV
jgi:hypothetical protein